MSPSTLVPIEETDSADLDRLEAAHSRGARIMLKVVLITAVVVIAVAIAVGSLTPHGGVAGSIGAVVLVFVLIVFFGNRRRLAKLKLDRASGKKVRVEATVDRKEHTSGAGNAPSHNVFLHLAGRRYWVDEESYQSVEEGDRIRFEYLPTAELVLRITSLD